MTGQNRTRCGHSNTTSRQIRPLCIHSCMSEALLNAEDTIPLGPDIQELAPSTIESKSGPNATKPVRQPTQSGFKTELRRMLPVKKSRECQRW